MRDYQVQGLNWMVGLHYNGINGILADEMVCFSSSLFVSSTSNCLLSSSLLLTSTHLALPPSCPPTLRALSFRPSPSP